MKSNLLNIYRMMGKPKEPTPPSEGYIKDGLVFHLDGIDKGSDPTAWTDLIEGRRFVYHDCVVNDNNVEFDGISSYAIGNRAWYASGKSTIEVAMYSTRKQPSILFVPQSGDGVCFGWILTQLLWNSDSSASKRVYIYNPIGIHTTSVNVNTCVNNRSVITGTANPLVWLSRGVATVGGRYNGEVLDKPFQGKIYSIRIYNRQLSPEEMLHNQEVDIKRFNLPIGYIKFEDPEVERICVQNWSSDGVGLTYEDAEKVTTIGNVFKGNTTITKFNELQYFTGLTLIGNRSFAGCTLLSDITIPNSVKKIGQSNWSDGNGVFDGCSNLMNINIHNNITFWGGQTFKGCTNLKLDLSGKLLHTETIGLASFGGCKNVTGVIDAPNLTYLGKTAFAETSITEVKNLGLITTITGGSNWFNNIGCFQECLSLLKASIPNVELVTGNLFLNDKELKFVEIGTNVNEMGGDCFKGCSVLETLIIKNQNPPKWVNDALSTTIIRNIYVPDASIDAYKAAPTWSTYANKIKPLSQYVEPVNQ